MQSGAAFPAEPIDSSVAQATYNRIVSEVGCATAKSTVQCLRDAPYEKLLDATNKLPYLYSPAGFHINFVPRPDNSDDFFTISEFAPGHGIVDVPLIVGHQEDEATTFMVPTSDISTRAALGSMLQDNFPHTPRSVIDKLVSYYRGDSETGAPFRTNASQNAYPNSKVVSAVVTDVTFFFHIRNFLQSLVGPSAIVHRKSPVWAFQGAYLHGFPFIGTFHGSDLALLGGAFPNLESVKNDILGRYIRFVRTGIPQVTAAGNLEWPTYGAKKELLQFNADGEKIIKDNFRQKAFEYFETAKGFFRF
jgi:carboxylesterase type B